MKHQYKSNWCLIRGVSVREFYLAETLSTIEIWDLFKEKNRVFLGK
jgi:hypothetical protein